MEPVIELTEENEMDIINVTTPFTRACYNEFAEIAEFNNITVEKLIDEGMSGFMESISGGEDSVCSDRIKHPDTMMDISDFKKPSVYLSWKPEHREGYWKYLVQMIDHVEHLLQFKGTTEREQYISEAYVITHGITSGISQEILDMSKSELVELLIEFIQDRYELELLPEGNVI